MMSVPDPDYILRVPDHSPISSLQHEEHENYLLSGHQNGTILVRFSGDGRTVNWCISTKSAHSISFRVYIVQY